MLERSVLPENSFMLKVLRLLNASTSTSSPSPHLSLHQAGDDRPQGQLIERAKNLNIAQVREALRIPEDGLSSTHIASRYPDWPTEASGKEVWRIVLDALRKLIEEYADGVTVDDKRYQWNISGPCDYESQNYVIQTAVINSAYDTLSSDDRVNFVAERLRCCENEWALRFLLTTRAIAHKRRDSRAANRLG
ncbi:hypothetical protein TWF506_004382 [Arthrobotrys conoides]|uniref:Uncharacterized protein n=1 Tax=Arthrobotrys conoides TaxID=74498 RepID=A0AAN8RPA8_9PEZI